MEPAAANDSTQIECVYAVMTSCALSVLAMPRSIASTR